MSRRRIAVMLDTGSGWSNGILRGIVHYALAHGPWEFYAQFPGLSILAVRDWNVDGVIMPLRTEEYVRLFRERHIPLVNCSGMLAGAVVPTVRVDDPAAGRLGAEHLVERGFRHFAFCGFAELNFSDVRGEGFTEVVRRAGFDVNAYAPEPALKKEWTWDRQELDIARWLATLPRPVGLMACSDERAWHVTEACRRIGLRVPEDVAVVGVDNDELRCEFSTPPISSVAVPTERIGYESAALLDRLMRGEPLPDGPVLIRPQGVVVRRSTDVVAVDDPDVVKAFHYIRDHASEPFDVNDLVKEVATPLEVLEERFCAHMGHTIEAEIQRARVRRAERILSDTDLGIPEAAQASGFRNPSHFSSAFRRVTGLTPNAYRQKYRMR
jgi:LacI family transcriptional regulator